MTALKLLKIGLVTSVKVGMDTLTIQTAHLRHTLSVACKIYHTSLVELTQWGSLSFMKKIKKINK